MTHTQWKIIVDVLLAITFVSLMITGIWPQFTFQHVGRAGFTLLHVQAGEVFVVLGLIHFGLNWRWVRTHLFRRKVVAKSG